MAKKKQRIPSHVKNSIWSNLRYIFYMLFPLICLAPYFRGLFFDEELVIAHMFTAVVAGLYFYFNKNEAKISRNLMDYAGIGLIVAYILSSFVAYNSRDAVGEVLKVLNYFLVYWLVSKLAKNTADLQKIILTFFISSVGVALIGIGAAFGTFTYNGAFQDGLINSTLQYHNAGAIYMVAGGLLGLYLAMSMGSQWQRILIAGANNLVFMTAFGAGSRGAILVTPIVIFIQFLGFPREAKLKLFYNLLAIFIPFALTAKSVLTFGEKSAAFHWGILSIGIILTMSLQYLVEKLQQSKIKINLKKSHLLWTGLIIFVALIGVIAVMGSDIMPESKVQRSFDFDLKDANVQERFYFYKDAFKIIKEHPILGVGGGGWNSIYRQYQSYNYSSSEVHSHPIQVWVEGGLFGFLCFILLWIGLLTGTFKVMRRTSASIQAKTLTWTALAAALSLGLHSCIDFTLSLGAPMIFLWSLFGIVRNAMAQSTEEDGARLLNIKLQPAIIRYAGIGIVSLFFLVSFSFWVSDVLTEQAYSADAAGDLAQSVETFETATVFDPFDYMLFYNLATLEGQLAYNTGDRAGTAEALKTALKAQEKNRGDSQSYWLVANLYLSTGRPEQAIQAAEAAIRLAPLIPETYVQLAGVYNNVANMYMEMGNSNGAKEMARRVLDIPNEMKQKDAALDDQARALFKGAKLSQLTIELQEQLKLAQNTLAK